MNIIAISKPGYGKSFSNRTVSEAWKKAEELGHVLGDFSPLGPDTIETHCVMCNEQAVVNLAFNAESQHSGLALSAKCPWASYEEELQEQAIARAKFLGHNLSDFTKEQRLFPSAKCKTCHKAMTLNLNRRFGPGLMGQAYVDKCN